MVDERRVELRRETGETSVQLEINLDGSGNADIDTGVGFLDHMLELFARHGQCDLKIKSTGDLQVDSHHTTEDIGIVLGNACRQALGEKRGIIRFADVRLPMQEALVQVALDISGRTFFYYNVPFPTSHVGTFDTELVQEFFLAFAHNAGVTLHIDLARGDNAHHVAEAVFKGVARAFRKAASYDQKAPDSVPSTKGTL